MIDKNFYNKKIILTGNEPMYVNELLKMIKEILLINSPIKYKNIKYAGHYITTPYSYNNVLKYNPKLTTDLGQGLLELINYIDNEINH